MPITLQSTHWARLAAIVALVAGASVLAIGVYTVAEDFEELMWVLGFVFVVAFFAWLVLIRRGLARVLGVPVGLLAIAGLIAIVSSHLLLLLALTGMLALFGGAARYATRRGETVRQVDGNGRPAQPARKGVLIINPNSGGGKAERFDLQAEARKRGVEPLLLTPGTDLRASAEKAVSDGADVIGMAGGDGSQALLATVAMRHGVSHVCVPAGTRNHFALDLGLDRDDVVGALDAFTDGVERRIDLASVNDHVFVNNASLGVYAQVVQSDAYRDAKVGTWKRMLPDMLGPGDVAIASSSTDPTQVRGRTRRLWSSRTTRIRSSALPVQARVRVSIRAVSESSRHA